MSNSMALAKRSAETALMPPPPPPKRIKRPAKVLDEDTYTSALSHIIARDFFPGLLEVESQQDYLNALDAGDDEWIEEAEKRVREVLNTPRGGRRGVNMTPQGIGGETPRDWRGETPLRTPGRTLQATPSANSYRQHTTGAKDEPVDVNLSLSAFQAKYTSEDNESFNKVLDRQNEKRQEKYQWLWNGNKIPSARQIAQAAREQRLLLLGKSNTSDDKNMPLSNGSSQSQALTLRPSQDQDARPASITTRPHNPRNTFMFGAASVDEYSPDLPTVQQVAEEKSRAGPKAVSYSSTRLSNALQNTLNGADADDDTSTTASAIDAAIHGHPRHRAVSTAVPSEADGTGNETPRVNGYTFVDEEPTPSELGISPSSPPPANRKKTKNRDDTDLIKQLIEAQGGIVGEGSNLGVPNPFSIAESSSREKTHHRLVDRHLAANRISDKNKLLNQRNDRLATLRGGDTAKGITPRFLSSPAISRTPWGATAGSLTPLGANRDRTPAELTAKRRKMQAGNLTPAARGLYERVGRTPRRGGGGGGGGGDVNSVDMGVEYNAKDRGGEKHAFDMDAKGEWTPRRTLRTGKSTS